jgi:hypothetical protein
MNRRISLSIVAVLALVFGAACLGQEIVGATDQTATTTGNTRSTFHSASGGYSISLPDGWVQIPDDKVQKVFAAVYSSPHSSSCRWDAAFQRQGYPDGFNYPYVIVSVFPYAGGRESDNAEIAALLKEISGTDIDKAAQSEGNPQVANLLSNGSVGQAQWDDNEKTVRLPLQMKVASAVTVKAIMTGRFGRRALICVVCYATDADFGVRRATFRQISDSFQFDPGSKYDDGVNALTSQTARLSNGIFDGTGNVLLRTALGAVMGSAVGAIGWMWKALKS